MTERKWTPGPWVVAEKYNCKDVRVADGPYISDCNASMAVTWDVKIANAHLIAAAPELYEALEYLASLCQLGDDADWGAGEDPLSVAEAALAKARGEA